MDGEEDFQSIPPEEEPSPQIQLQRLKRLKKANPKSPPNPIDDPLRLSSVDFSKLKALENESGDLDSNDSNSTDDTFLYQESLSQGIINENEDSSKDNLDNGSNAGVKKTKRALEFDAEHVGDIELEKSEKEQSVEEIFSEEKGSTKKKNRGKGDDMRKAVNKRREEKERKAHLKELHAETQRLLRESSHVAFKPMPVTRKPISSILEKIRKRKLELSKKFSVLKDQTCVSEDDNSLSELMDLDVSNINEMKTEEKHMVTSGVDVQKILTPSKLDGCHNVVRPINPEVVNQALNEGEPMLPFRAPLQDTEDLFGGSQSNDSPVEPDSEKQSGPLDKEFVPSVLDINLKFDSVSTDDSSSDDEDNDKENVDPDHVIPGGPSSKDDSVKNFVDDEAEEEDDSDDPDHLHENEEDEDVENYEELQDMIATEYEEKPIDKERRTKLHMQWLEQQDATGTDNLLQRLKCGPGIRDTILSDKEPESDEDDIGLDDDDEAEELTVPRNFARVTTRKAKQIILQLFSDKEDVYLSDNDEDSDWRNAKHCLNRNLQQEEDTLVSPVNEDTGEVFGLIKKLNITTGNKKKPKPSSYFDTVLKRGNSSSSKSSFLGRGSNHPIPSSNKQGTGMVRSFIFGRDDSSSRSSITVSEDSSDSVSREIHSTRIFAAKPSSSQTKFSSKSIDTTASTTSLLEILKRPLSRPNISDHDTFDLSRSIFPLKVQRKTMKIQRRS